MKIRPGHLVEYTGANWVLPRVAGVVLSVDEAQQAWVKWDAGLLRQGIIPEADLRVVGDLLEQQWAADAHAESGDVPG